MFIPLYWMNKRIRAAWWKRPLIELRALYQTWGGHRYQKPIAQLIDRAGVNVIHTSTILNPEGAIAAKRNGIPHVWHVRELVGPGNHFQFYNYNGWAGYVQNHCRWLIANSVFTQQCLLRFFPASKIQTIPNGIEVHRFRLHAHTNTQPRVVGMVGSVTTRWKNHAFFIRVAQALRHVPGVAFRIYGSLPPASDAYFRDLRRLNEVCPVVDFVPFGKPETIMAELDVLFHPSLYESFGRIYAEAMAAGVPVVAARAGAATELVQEGVTGYLVADNDIDTAAKRVLNLLESSELRAKMGRSGRQKVEAEYTLDRLANRMHALYEEMISENRSN